MAIQDSDAERRNLMMSSIGFILYYIAGGQFVDNQVKIQVVNLTFSKPHILAIAAWVMLFWFLLRYWQTHKNKASSTISSDISNVLATNLRHILLLYISIKKDLKIEENKGFILNNIDINLFHWIANITIVDDLSKKEDGTPQSYTPISEESFYLKGPIGFLFVSLATFIACVKNQGFTSYIVPYILFLFAVSIPIIEWVY